MRPFWARSPQFDVPVSQINEVFPAIVLAQAEADLHEWPPFWPLGLSDQIHPRLVRCAVRLGGVALDAGADDVLPSRGPSPVPGDDVVKIQILPVKRSTAILACFLVPLENIVACEFDLLLGEVIIDQQKDHSGNADSE